MRIEAALAISLCILPVEARSADMKSLYDRYCRPYADVRDIEVLQAEVAALDDTTKTMLLETSVLQGDGEDGDMRACAWFLLAEAQDRRVLPILLQFIEDTTQDPSDRDEACRDTWSFIGNDLVPTMLKVLAEPGGVDSSAIRGLRMCTIMTLGETNDDSARARLRELLADTDYSWSDLEIIEALGSTRDAAAVPQLLAIVAPPGVEVKKFATAKALAEIGTRESVAPLVSLLQRLPAGWSRFDRGTEIARALNRAIEETQDAELHAELIRVKEAVLALARDIPGLKPPET